MFAVMTSLGGIGGTWGGDFESTPTSNKPVLPRPKVVWWRKHEPSDPSSEFNNLPVHDSSLPEQCRGIPLIKVIILFSLKSTAEHLGLMSSLLAYEYPRGEAPRAFRAGLKLPFCLRLSARRLVQLQPQG